MEITEEFKAELRMLPVSEKTELIIALGRSIEAETEYELAIKELMAERLAELDAGDVEANSWGPFVNKLIARYA